MHNLRVLFISALAYFVINVHGIKYEGQNFLVQVSQIDERKAGYNDHDLLLCTYKCMLSSDCCVAFYDTVTESCLLDQCCFRRNKDQFEVILLLKMSRLGKL